MLGPNLTEAMTQDYLVSENWRIWPIIFLLWAILGSAYGTSGTSTRSYLIGFGIVSAILFVFIGNPLESNYNIDKVLFRFTLATALSLFCFFAMRYYSNNVEEYKVNRAKKNIGYAAVSTFFLTIILLDPPEIIRDIAGQLVGFGILESQLELLTRDGVPPARWGGLLINLIVAAAGCVLGFAIGVFLAFSRQSTLPILKWPGVAVIEIVRSGPLICWLYFAMYLLPDVADPLFTNPEDFDNIVRMMAIFSLFGGCYIAEVIRGGLQAVDSGQKEAALALGLSPTQIKLQIELPNAVRTTLPSIVSVFIGLWKDTTLLFIIEIVDFFRISKTMANTDLRFLGDFLEPVYFTAIVFWVFAFYLSRVSMGVEKGLGLVKEGGGDVA
jgi:His/Glu/Gln/Arg/opine family amino acid ABC transporter permease subunit